MSPEFRIFYSSYSTMHGSKRGLCATSAAVAPNRLRMSAHRSKKLCLCFIREVESLGFVDVFFSDITHCDDPGRCRRDRAGHSLTHSLTQSEVDIIFHFGNETRKIAKHAFFSKWSTVTPISE